MGKVIEDFDGQIMPIRNAYLNATGRGKWMLATHYLEMLHNTLPPKARISNLPEIKIEESLKGELDKETISLKYCRKWMPLIESTIAIHRDQMLRALNE